MTTNTKNGHNLVGNLIHLVNELQDKLNPLGKNLALDLPQIVVIGGQSSGKSSVLESIVGHDFLPRGSGTVTRRPLVLQIINNKAEKDTYGVFSHIPAKRFTEFHKIRDEITRDTNKEVSGQLAISNKPIKLKIYSPDLLDLTLVDLPGIVRNPSGDQPADIEKLTKDMTLDYIRNDNSLILAVTSANQDLAVSDAITLARQVDPQGDRTIGVLTKLDITDDVETARTILLGKHPIYLKRGFIGVINRSQSDIDDDIDIRSALEKEKRFFRTHQAFKDMSDRMGIEFLHRELQRVLQRHIALRLPPLKDMFESNIHDLNEKLDIMQTPIGEIEKSRILSEALKQFDTDFRTIVGGKLLMNYGDNISRGVIINKLMNDRYGSEIESVLYNDLEMKKHIGISIQNIYGSRNGLFISDAPFIFCVQKQIDHYSRPSIDCVEWVTSELKQIVRESLENNKRFPNMTQVFESHTLEFINLANKRCKDYVRHFIDEEKIVNINHDDFVNMTGLKLSQNNGLNKAVNTAEENDNSSNELENDNYKVKLEVNPKFLDNQVDEIKVKVNAYITILKKTFKDRLPKICILELIDRTADFISAQLMDEVRAKYQSIGDIIGKDAEEELRMNYENQRKQYKDAVDIILKCQTQQ